MGAAPGRAGRSLRALIELPVVAALVILATSCVSPPEPEVRATFSYPALVREWECPRDVALLKALREAHEYLEGEPAVNEYFLRSAGLEPPFFIDAVIEDERVVGRNSGFCGMPTFGGRGFPTHCSEELDAMAIDIVVGGLLARRDGSTKDVLRRAEEAGVGNGPYEAYRWNDAERRPEVLDERCPSPEEIDIALDLDSDDLSYEERCSVEWRAMASAVEQYEAESGVRATNEQALVDDGHLRRLSEHYDLLPEGGVVPAKGSSCPVRPDDSEPAPDPDVGLSLEECYGWRNALELAAGLFETDTGRPPADEQALVDAGYLPTLVEAYDLDSDGGVVAVPGAGCA